jgi:hypothetical protein
MVPQAVTRFVTKIVTTRSVEEVRKFEVSLMILGLDE